MGDKAFKAAMDLRDITATAEAQATLQQQLWMIAQTPWKSGILPNANDLAQARASLPSRLANDGRGFEPTKHHILNDIVPAFNGSSISAHYYGFVTGGVTPAALFADNIVSAYDQNVQVHLPDHSIATDVESSALGLLVDLLGLERADWHNGTFTTGGSSSNVLGLACGREYVLRVAASKAGIASKSVGEHGLFEVMRTLGLSGVQVLSTLPHSSLVKAAGILGIGRANIINVCQDNNPLLFDMKTLELALVRSEKASIVAVSCGEVNTGQFATAGIDEMRELRRLCDKYGAWLHADGAFGIFNRVLDDSPEFATIKKGVEGIELADSIAGDGHKMLNVPYDCGFFLCRHPNEASNVFQNANAAYLTGNGNGPPSIPSPLNIGVENSRRFRALPVYASLVAYGRTGYQAMLEKQIRLARMISGWLYDHSGYNVLPEADSKEESMDQTFMVVLFTAKQNDLNENLATKINKTSKIFVSGTSWQGKPACRIAISNWRVDEVKDFELVTGVLQSVVEGRTSSN
jgi:glutamate/tyrosine decarboxylase-like PLP-dependent enzyme